MKLYIAILLFKQFITIHGSALLPEEKTNSDRVVDNYEDIIRGVPLDFTYNETATSDNNGFPSVPGCPKSEVGIPWIYYGSPTKCHLAGERGPCESYEKLFVELGSPFGICNCECFENKERLTMKKLQFCSEGGRQFVFDPEFKKCFQLYEQGPCKENEWLVKVDGDAYTESNFRVRCKPRTCPDGKLPNIDKEGIKNTTEPCVFPPFSPYAGPAFIGPNDCKDGTKYSKTLSKCVKNPGRFFMTS